MNELLTAAAAGAQAAPGAALYVSGTDEAARVTAFSYRSGSFIPCVGGEPQFVSRLNLHIEADGQALQIALPAGFSFDYNQLTGEKTLAPEAGGVWDLPVYPLYSESQPEAVSIRLTGAVDQTLDFPVSAPAEILIRSEGGREEDFRAAAPANHLWTGMGAAYNKDLAWLCNLLTFPGGRESPVLRQNFEALGFVDIECKPLEVNDTDGLECWFASRTVIVAGQPRHVVGMVNIGTYESAQWTGNFTVWGLQSVWFVADPTVHYGFEQMAKKLEGRLDDYCAGHDLLPGSTGLFVTGHSRGAAAADIIVHEYTDKFADAVAYAFAPPNTTQNPTADANIHNFVYDHDIVPYLPNWSGYGKYGQTYVFGSENAEEADRQVDQLHDILWYPLITFVEENILDTAFKLNSDYAFPILRLIEGVMQKALGGSSEESGASSSGDLTAALYKTHSASYQAKSCVERTDVKTFAEAVEKHRTKALEPYTDLKSYADLLK